LSAGVAAVRDVELREDRGDVMVDSSGGEDQPAGDLGVGQALGDQAEDVDLPFGEAGGVFAGAGPRSPGDPGDAVAA